MSFTLETPKSAVDEAARADVGAAILAKVRQIAPRLAARGPELDATRSVPLDIIDELRSMGVFRMYTPRSHGGLELDFPVTLDILTALAVADGSIGWTAFIGSGAGLFNSTMSEVGFDRVYANGPDVITAGTAAPIGRAERVEGGYRITGRWPFASGCRHADLIWGGCVVTEGGEPVVGPAPGVPAITWIGLPASEWTIEDTWFVSGLKGTGSSHVSIKDAFAPTANEFNLFGASHLPGPLYSAPSILSLLTHCGPALGIAEGALADLVAMANAGRQQAASRTSMRDSPLFQAELGRVEAEVRAARAMTESQAASHWRRAKAGETHNDAWAIEGFQTIVWVTLTCQRAVDACYALGGGQALYETSALQRRLRDIHAVTQHVAAQPKHYLAAGELKLGFPPRNPILG